MPMLASPATESPAMTPTASGRNSGSSTASAAKATNRPLPVIALKKSAARRRRRRPRRALTAMRDDDRHGGEHGQAGQVAPPAEDDHQLGDQEARRDRRRRGRRAVGRPATSAADIEALPGQRDEHVLQAGRCTAKPSTGTPAWTRSGTIFSTATSPSGR